MDENLGPCPICGRDLISGKTIDRHHWVPRLKGGRETDWVHRICHKMIHRLFTEAELARRYSTAEALKAHPDMARFIAWVAKKPPTFTQPTRFEAGRRSKRRR